MKRWNYKCVTFKTMQKMGLTSLILLSYIYLFIFDGRNRFFRSGKIKDRYEYKYKDQKKKYKIDKQW